MSEVHSDYRASSLKAHAGAQQSLSVPLIIKVAADSRLKRLRFADHTRVTYDDFRGRIARAFQLVPDPEQQGDRFSSSHSAYSSSVGSSYSNGGRGGNKASGSRSNGGARTNTFDITYCDDDGEECDIGSEEDLQEAISYFAPSDLSASIRLYQARLRSEEADAAFGADGAAGQWDEDEDAAGSISNGSSSGNRSQPPAVEMRVAVRVRSLLSLSDWSSVTDLDLDLDLESESGRSGFSSSSWGGDRDRRSIRSDALYSRDGESGRGASVMMPLPRGSSHASSRYSAYESSAYASSAGGAGFAGYDELSQSSSYERDSVGSSRHRSSNHRRSEYSRDTHERDRGRGDTASSPPSRDRTSARRQEPAQPARQVRFSEKLDSSSAAPKIWDAELDSLHFSDLNTHEEGEDGSSSDDDDEHGGRRRSGPGKRRTEWKRRASEPPAPGTRGRRPVLDAQDEEAHAEFDRTHPYSGGEESSLAAGREGRFERSKSAPTSRAITPNGIRERESHQPHTRHLDAITLGLNEALTSSISTSQPVHHIAPAPGAAPPGPMMGIEDGLSQLGRRSELDSQSVQLFTDGIDPLGEGSDSGSDDSRETISRHGSEGRPSMLALRSASAAQTASRSPPGAPSAAVAYNTMHLDLSGQQNQQIAAPGEPTAAAATSVVKAPFSTDDARLLESFQQSPQSSAPGDHDDDDATTTCRCSNCSTIFDRDSLRYVCDTCGARRPSAMSNTTSSSSTAGAGSGDPLGAVQSPTESSPRRDSSSASSEGAAQGFELCLACIGEEGERHVRDPRHTEEKRHAFFELVFQAGKWTPVGEALLRTSLRLFKPTLTLSCLTPIPRGRRELGLRPVRALTVDRRPLQMRAV